VFVQVEPEALQALQLGPAVLTPSRVNGFLNMLEAMRKRARALSGAFLPTFPSLRVSADATEPRGAFAVAQAQFLQPDPAQVDALVKVSGSLIPFPVHVYSLGVCLPRAATTCSQRGCLAGAICGASDIREADESRMGMQCEKTSPTRAASMHDRAVVMVF
jgi:hypothetical protein